MFSTILNQFESYHSPEELQKPNTEAYMGESLVDLQMGVVLVRYPRKFWLTLRTAAPPTGPFLPLFHPTHLVQHCSNAVCGTAPD